MKASRNANYRFLSKSFVLIRGLSEIPAELHGPFPITNLECLVGKSSAFNITTPYHFISQCVVVWILGMRTRKTLAECTANSLQAPWTEISVMRSVVAGSWKGNEVRRECPHFKSYCLIAFWPCPLNLHEGMEHLQI